MDTTPEVGSTAAPAHDGRAPAPASFGASEDATFGVAAPAGPPPWPAMADRLSLLLGLGGARIEWKSAAVLWAVWLGAGLTETLVGLIVDSIRYSGAGGFEPPIGRMLLSSLVGATLWVASGMVVLGTRRRHRVSSPAALAAMVAALYGAGRVVTSLAFGHPLKLISPAFSFGFAFCTFGGVLWALRQAYRPGRALGLGYLAGGMAASLVSRFLYLLSGPAFDLVGLVLETVGTSAGALVFGGILPLLHPRVRDLGSAVAAPPGAAPEAAHLAAAFRATRARHFRNHMLLGLGCAIAGSALTAASFGATAAAGGGRYVVFWGAIVFGIIDFFRGLFGWLAHQGAAPGTVRDDREA